MGNEMSEDTASIAVLATKIDHVTKTMEEIKSTLATSSSVHVTRSEWEMRNQTVDERFLHYRHGLDQLNGRIDQQEAKKAPWWQVLSAIGTIAAIVGLALIWVPQVIN